jgi:hypothetical protein
MIAAPRQLVRGGDAAVIALLFPLAKLYQGRGYLAFPVSI